jgi:hypothetical protein
MFVRNFDLILDPAAAMQIAMLVREFDTEDIDPTGEEYSGDEAFADEEDLLEKEKQDQADPYLEELSSAVNILNVDAQRDLLALMWVGRGDYRPEDWAAARHQAADVADMHLAKYLSETPLASTYLIEGLSQMGYSVDDYEAS